MKKLEDYRFMSIFPSAPVSDAQVSPDGSQALFVYSEVNMGENKYDSHLWITGLRSGKPRQFTHGRSNESYPHWSPKGDRVLFLSNRLGELDKPDAKPKPQLFVMPTGGGEAVKLTFMDEAVARPEWSPDGRSVLFSARVFKGEKAYEESDVKIIRRIKYRFDGQGYFEGKWTHLFTVPSGGGKVKQITDGEFDVEAYAWSPDGKQVAFVANMDKDADMVQFKNIYLVPAKGGEHRLLWRGLGPIEELAWSPDGGHLAFTGHVIDDPDLVFYKSDRVFALPLDGGEPKCLTERFDITAGGELSWSPDSEHIYFTAPYTGSTHVCRVSMGGELEWVTEGKISVGGYSLDDSGETIIYTATDDATPSELYALDGDSPRKVTDMNRGLLRKLKWSPPEEFWYMASDGVKVQGWIVKPHGYVKGEKYPTVLQIHGGPRGAYGYGVNPASHEFQVLASHGYAVVYTNPRGSTGFGEEFAAAISGHWGERDYLDLMEAVDYVVESYGYVDASRLGVAGGSYGGYMTNWMIGHTDRFRAAVTMRSISNWYSMWGTSDISYRSHEVTWGKYPWDNLEEVMAKSPITYMGGVKTPTLILHSEEDYRCPMEQDEQLFTALMKLGVPTEFVRFPNEPHGLSRTGKPKHRVERLQHIVRWFDRYLKGEE
jgi:dipeptidyl aminopeptidase/acylaminoacyl peptidase